MSDSSSDETNKDPLGEREPTEGSLITTPPKAGSVIDHDPQPRFIHFCAYTVIRRSITHSQTGIRWIERCRCGRMVDVDRTYIVEGSKFPTVRRCWFDREGNLVRVTGTKDLRDQQ